MRQHIYIILGRRNGKSRMDAWVKANPALLKSNKGPLDLIKLIEGGSNMRRYTFGHFIFDLFMTCITGGLWFLWILFKYYRTH